MDPVAAARGNVWLLVIVSLWRVLLISRVASVLSGASFFATGVFVTAAASFEFIVAGVVQQFTNFERGIASSMAGIRIEQSPAERAAETLIGQLAILLFGIVIVSSITTLSLSNYQKRPFPKISFGPVPITLLLFGIAIPIIAGWLAKPMQQAEIHWSRLESQLMKSEYVAALDYLESVGPDAFPKGKAIPIGPDQYQAIWLLPKLLPHLNETRPEWMRTLYLNHTKNLVGMLQPYGGGGPALLKKLTEGVLKLPDEEAFIKEHLETWLSAPGGPLILDELGIHPILD
jgi:hypothetical protein